jgi:hypothetical protein
LEIVQFQSSIQAQRFLERFRSTGAHPVSGLSGRVSWATTRGDCARGQCAHQFMLSSRAWTVMGTVTGTSEPAGTTLVGQIGQSVYRALSRTPADP